MLMGLCRLLTALIFSACLYAQASDRIDQMLAQLERVHHFGGVSISPDGAWATWTEQTTGGNDQIYFRSSSSAGQAEAIRVTAGEVSGAFSEIGVAWSNDSNNFAFISNAGGSQQVYVASVAAPAKPKQLTHVKGDIADLRWSLDGKQLAFLNIEGGGAGGPLAAVPAQTGVIGSTFQNQRLVIVDVSSGASKAVTSKDLNIYEYSWSPDGAKFAAIAAPGPADNNWWIAKLYTVDAALRSAHRDISSHSKGQQIAVPRWSPDGSRIGFYRRPDER